MKYYVDNTAASSGSGTSWSSAFQSLSSINWSVVKPGDTIYVSGGSTSQTYNESLSVGASGSAAGQVTITRGVDPGHNGQVIIDGQNTRSGVSLYGKNYVTVDGLSIRNTVNSGVSVKNATAGAIIQNNSVSVGDPGDVNARGYDIRNNVGTNAVIVRNNSFSTAANTLAQKDGIYSQGNDGVVYDSNRIVVSNSNTNGHSDDFQSYTDRSVTVRNNWFEQANTASVNNHGAWMSDTQTGGVITFANNVVLAPNLTGDAAVTHWKEATWTGTGTANIQNNTIIGGRRTVNLDGNANDTVRNNILEPAAGGFAYVIANATVPAGNISGNDVWAANASIASLNGPTLTWSQWQASGYAAGGVNADPKFTNPAAGDYSLSSASPAKGDGAVLTQSATGPATSATTPTAPSSTTPTSTTPSTTSTASTSTAPAPAPTNVTTINLTGNYYGTISNATLQQTNSTQGLWIGLTGSNDIVLVSGASDRITASGNNNTVKITANTGTNNVDIAGANNLVDAGIGWNTIKDNGSNNTLVLHAATGIRQDLYGAILTNGDVLDVRNVLGATNWNGSASTVASYITVQSANNGADTNLLVSATAGGKGTIFANLHNTGTVTEAMLLPHLKTN